MNSVAFSFCPWLGSAADSASAAEAPQIAVAPPESRPNSLLKPMARAATIDTRMVTLTSTTTIATGCQPRAAISVKVMRRPSSATPTRRISRAVNSMPALHGPSVARKFTDRPSSRANSITGAP
ncbi:hypothetical protein D9M71_264640 [compost metagenome]